MYQLEQIKQMARTCQIYSPATAEPVRGVIIPLGDGQLICLHSPTASADGFDWYVGQKPVQESAVRTMLKQQNS